VVAGHRKKQAPLSFRNLASATAGSKAFTYPEQLLASFFGTSNVGLAICDRRLRFLAVNDTLAKMNGTPARDHIGKTIRDILGDFTDVVEPLFRRVFLTGRPVLNYVVSGVLPTRRETGHWIENYFPIWGHTGAIQQVGAVVVEITKERTLEQSLRDLNRKLMRARDEEQRRIARELHDSLNQYHTALKLNLGLLRRRGDLTLSQRRVLRQSFALLGQCIEETRTISRLLHPAVLDMLGLEPAARTLLGDFSRRSGVITEFKSNLGSRRLPAVLELTLFRVLQEALTNVQRHAKSALVSVSIAERRNRVVLTIADSGRGIPARKLQSFRLRNVDRGIGLMIMRERIEEQQGELTIVSSSRGTKLMVNVPKPFGRATPRKSPPRCNTTVTGAS
jgi:PAS domain S-box-containing protein